MSSSNSLSSQLETIATSEIKVRNSRGSSAAAGSGDCHTYLASRRLEMFRLQGLQEKHEKEAKDKEWTEKMNARIEESDQQKKKNAEKRKAKKEKRKAAIELAKASKKQKLAEPREKDQEEHALNTEQKKQDEAKEEKIVTEKEVDLSSSEE